MLAGKTVPLNSICASYNACTTNDPSIAKQFLDPYRLQFVGDSQGCPDITHILFMRTQCALIARLSLWYITCTRARLVAGVWRSSRQEAPACRLGLDPIVWRPWGWILWSHGAHNVDQVGSWQPRWAHICQPAPTSKAYRKKWWKRKRDQLWPCLIKNTKSQGSVGHHVMSGLVSGGLDCC